VRIDYLEPLQTRRNSAAGYLRQSTPRSQPPRSSGLVYVTGGLSLVLSFLVTLQLTKPGRLPDAGAATLASSVVHDLRTLSTAAKAAGLKASPNVKGDIDEIQRLDIDRVSLKGWAAKVGSGRTPLSVITFVAGRSNTPIAVEAMHPSLTQPRGFSDAAAENNSFQVTLTCHRGEKLLAAAITQDNEYGLLGLRLCP
jgi:hypothetical protein